MKKVRFENRVCADADPVRKKGDFMMKRILYLLLTLVLLCTAASLFSVCAADWSAWTEDTSKLNNSAYEHQSKTQISTRTKSTKTSTSPSMTGWTRDDSKTTSSITWSGTTNYYDSKQQTSETFRYKGERSVHVGQKTNLYRYTNGSDYLTRQKSGYWREDFWVWTSSVYKFDKYNSGQDLYMADEIAEEGSDYPCWKGDTKEIYKTQYGYESGTKVYTYTFYQYSAWSAWKDGTGTNNETTKVRTVYRYKLKEHTVTYNYAYNGGSSASKTSAAVGETLAVDLSPTAVKSGWTFVGWNTSADATAKLSSLTMGTGNITLYAIFKKTLTATFIDYSGAAKTTRTADVTIYNRATSGTVRAPAQNTCTGWYQAVKPGTDVYVPNLAYSAEELEVLGKYQADLRAYVKEQQTKYIIGDESALSDPEAFKAYLFDKLGLQEVLDIADAAYQRQYAK